MECELATMTLDDLIASAREVGFLDSGSIRNLARGAVILRPDEASDAAQFASKLGGLPALPPSVPWPQRDGRSLAFIAQIELASQPRIAVEQGLPEERYPDQIQGDMMVECAMVSAGLYCGDATAYEDPRRPLFRKQACEWRLLLQVPSAESAGMMWGDAGCLYYWIREDDLRARRFERSWMILQCG